MDAGRFPKELLYVELKEEGEIKGVICIRTSAKWIPRQWTLVGYDRKELLLTGII